MSPAALDQGGGQVMPYSPLSGQQLIGVGRRDLHIYKLFNINRHMYIHEDIHTCIHVYIHTYIHAYIYTYIHIYMHIRLRHMYLASEDELAYVKGVEAETFQRVRESVLARHQYDVNLTVCIHTYNDM